MSEKLNNEKQTENNESYESISSMIYEVRGVKVMLDFELAELYGYETRVFNQQVKNNIEKFDETFRFQLTEKELNGILRSKILTSSFEQDNPSTEVLPSKNLTANLDEENYDLILRSKKSTASLFDSNSDDYNLRSNNFTSSLMKQNIEENSLRCKNLTAN